MILFVVSIYTSRTGNMFGEKNKNPSNFYIKRVSTHNAPKITMAIVQLFYKYQ